MRQDALESSDSRHPTERRSLFRVSALPYVLLGVIGGLSLPLVILFASAGQIARSGDSAILLFAVPAFVVALGFAGLVFLLGRD
jgi:ABC-type sulfate transport system permease subunit